jgi:hypothetical protein
VHHTGWITALIAGTYHWQQMYAPLGNSSCRLIYWIKGAVGGEEQCYRMALQFTDDSFSDDVGVLELPAVTTEWQRVEVPVSWFLGSRTNVAVKALRLTAARPIATTFFLDQIYFTTTTTGVAAPADIQRSPSLRPSAELTILRPNSEQTPDNAAAIFDLSGRIVRTLNTPGRQNATKILILYSVPGQETGRE